MAREYHRKSCGVSRGVYLQVKGMLQDYDRLKRERIDLLYASGTADGMPRGSELGRSTEQRAIALAYIEQRLHAIDQSCSWMRGYLGAKVSYSFDPIKAYWSYDYYNCEHLRTQDADSGPCRRTWHNYKDRLTEVIAEKSNLF